MNLNELLTYLRTIDGGTAWVNTPDGSGAPDINFLLCGKYYGFFVKSEDKRLHSAQKAARASLEYAGASIHVVRNITDLDRVLLRDERRYRLHRAIDPELMREHLREWGTGSYRMDWLRELILKLPKKEKLCVMARYMDKLKHDAIGREMKIDERTVYQYLADAVDRLIEWTLEGIPEPEPIPEERYTQPGWQDV